jgi:hypothetical protein
VRARSLVLAFGFEHLGTRRDSDAGHAQRAVVAPRRQRRGEPAFVARVGRSTEATYEPEPPGGDGETERCTPEGAEDGVDAGHRAPAEAGGANAASTNAAC